MKKWKGFLSLAIAVLIIAPLSVVNAAPTCTINFDSKGGSAVASLENYECTDVIVPPSVPTKANNTFGGWYYDEDYDIPMSSTDVAGAHDGETLYARWFANDHVIKAINYTIDIGFGDDLDEFALTAPSGVHYKSAQGKFNTNLPSKSESYDANPTGTYEPDEDYFIEIYSIAVDDGYFISPNATIAIEGATTATLETNDSMYFLKIHTDKVEEPEDPVDDGEEEEPQINYYKVSFDVGGFGVDAEDIEFEENEIVDEEDLYLQYNISLLHFIGYYSDAEYKNPFVFGKPITKDIKVYARFITISDIEKAIATKVEAANLVLKSTVTQKEAVEYYKKAIKHVAADEEAYMNLFTLEGTVPTEFGDDYEFIDSFYYVDPTTEGHIFITYKYLGEEMNYSHELKVIYADSDNHDSELDEKANEITDKTFAITNYVDYKEFVKVENQEELKKLLDEAIKGIEGISEYSLETLQENIFKMNEDDPFSTIFREDVLYKGDAVYAYLMSSMGTLYKVDVPEGTANNHTAYMNAVKDDVKAFFESKGYKDVHFDVDDTDGKLYVYYTPDEDEEDADPYIVTLYMIKDKDHFLIAKNLFVSTIDYNNNFMRWGYSYALSEITDDMDWYISDYIKNSIALMKETLEGEGFEFFDGYEIDGYIKPGKTVTLTFTVGTENNNRKFKVLHKKADGTTETFEGVVKDGQFSIEVTETSPFAVGLGEVVKAQNNNPQTFDPIMASVLILVLSTIGLVGSALYFKKERM